MFNAKYVLFFVTLATMVPYHTTVTATSPQTKKRKPKRNNRRRQKPNKPRQNKPKPYKPPKPPKPIPQTPQNYEQVQKEDHVRVCNILGYASNIFGNFVQMVKEPKDQRNVGQQVGNMAQNIFHIVSEATKHIPIYKSPNNESQLEEYPDALEYLNSQDFITDLTSLILEQLETIETYKQNENT